MRPYYISAAKIAFLVASEGARRQAVKTTTTKFKAAVALNPSLESGVDQQVVESEPDLADPHVALGQLSAAVALLESELVEPTDPTLAVAEWFRLVGPAEYGILSRDSHPQKDPIATWFMEVPYSELGVAYWVVLTGSVGHLREEWAGRDHCNRSGSGTGAVFDVLAAISGQEITPQEVPMRDRFRAISWMKGMAPSIHPVHTIAEVKHVWAVDDSGFRAASGLPVVRIIVASPLFVEPHRTTRGENVDQRQWTIVDRKRNRWLSCRDWLSRWS